MLLDAAAEEGVEVREGFSVQELVFDQDRVVGIRGRGKGGRPVTEHARVVVGADGRHSRVAEAVKAEKYNESPPLQVSYYSYFSGLPMDGKFESAIRPQRAFAAWPTNDGLTLIITGWPIDELEANRSDIEGNFLATLETVPAFAVRVHAARREERFLGTAVPNYFRTPYGPGWALIGDAGYNRDFITAQGIQDAFRDAALCADALDETFRGVRTTEDAMAGYQSARDAQVAEMYQLTCQFATMEPPPPEMQQFLAAVSRDQTAMDGFARTIAGTSPPGEFFAPQNMERVLAGSD
jgi:flavin-dependent dehydrogenase